MPVLEIREAAFVRGGVRILQSLNITVEQGQRKTDVRDDPFVASLVARIAAGIVKSTEGKVFISDYDPAIQPVQAKRLVGFVPASLPEKQLAGLERYVRYRAKLWSIEYDFALRRARCALSALANTEPLFARTLAGALISAPPLIVLDQPPKGAAAAVLAAIGSAGLLTTHTCAHEARAWKL